MEPSLSTAHILVVDDEPAVANVIARLAQSFGYEVSTARSVAGAAARLDERPADVVLTDLHLGDGDGLDVLRRVLERSPEVPVVLITGQATVDSAMEAIQAGAFDYIAKPPKREALGAILRRAIERRRSAGAAAPTPTPVGPPIDRIAGRSPRMLEAYKTVARVADSRISVLILGESGTGKELVARALHERSDRAPRAFVAVNVSAIPEGLLESELFGHVKGAFTGAVSDRRGLFEEANHGTLFLDEIGDLSLPLQAKLLRVIQEHRIKRVGGNEETVVDVRLVVATHRDLQRMVQEGRFRQDLYYRLNVVAIVLPPLRDRPDDIPLLVSHFRRKFSRETGREAPDFTAEALGVLGRYEWPGNVRELENVVERALVLTSHGSIGPEGLPPGLGRDARRLPPDSGGFVPLEEMVERYVNQVIEHTHGNRTRAAEILGISRRTLHRMAARRRTREDGSDR